MLTSLFLQNNKLTDVKGLEKLTKLKELGFGDHVAAFEELEKIEPELRGHPDVLEVRAVIYAKAEKWGFCVEIGSALVRIAPERPSGWLKRSHALHQLGKTQDALQFSFKFAYI